MHANLIEFSTWSHVAYQNQDLIYDALTLNLKRLTASATAPENMHTLRSAFKAEEFVTQKRTDLQG
jgi:hypothetical protein